jgi:hypothetical protein
VTDAGVAAVARLPALRSLELPNCWRVTDAGAASLASVTGLCALDMSYCWKLTDAGAAALAASPLVRLTVTGCHRLTPRGRAAVQHLLDYPVLY